MPSLYLIPVPLGDEDFNDGLVQKSLPLYNIEAIRNVKYFIAESAKNAKRALKKMFFTCNFEVNVDDFEFFELNEHTNLREIYDYLEPMEQGNSMGVLSDAGCPCVADPGNAVVEMAHKKGFRVVPLVGPSSILMALMASGFSGQNFSFNGYLPQKEAERNQKIKLLEKKCQKENQTQIFIEAPYRNLKIFDAILKICSSETKLCIAAGITTSKEFIKTATITSWKKMPQPPIEKIPTIFLLGK